MSDPAGELHEIAFILNGETVSAAVSARMHLGDFIREVMGKTGTHIGCEHGVCGACNVTIDGRSVRSCLMLAVQADGTHVETIEGLTQSGIIADLQQEFVARNALQCGYCTPGILATAAEMLNGPSLSRENIREALSGNFCRCTGYHAIVDAIEAVMARRVEAAS
ncbi:(2Fe-2S)-binding protein [Pseudorhodoplanes sinuspersici]|uniref:(2Fe-2S)-binding protein n=1 Tax=Pseudorhodoplanes sinuspersici TaxID=1235591 RepID=A0A1W6ZYM6_9HYPH|nr:(2Fe-2S)-binding protein [Pseudorhodoplanes sinuspersici]ARQ02433.1 (2Fe-2S)-binding protein [Pseudorhodoplanes sinuspersici]RKE74269.1 carbon-monoxide dehydrogenase small subunit [Pseudorhodoplanes sinuspersici]